MTAASPERARSFDTWADDYDRYRPGYPEELFDRIANRFGLADDARAVDLGSGTGKVARHVAARGWRVTAVEPGAGMRAVLAEAAGREGVAVDVTVGTAEETGLPMAAYDVSLAGEAWHWFDAARALAEVARIVRPGGGLAFFWNVVEEPRCELAATEHALAQRLGIDASDIRQPGPRPETRDALRAAPGWAEPEFVQVPHVVRMTAASYLGWAQTKSHLRTAPADLQARFAEEFPTLCVAHGIGLTDVVDVPFTVDCWMTERSDR